MTFARILFPLLIAGLAVPAAAQQQSEGYKFLSAVRDAKGKEVLEMIGRPGSTIINARDVTTGDGALHIVVNRGDETYLRFLLQKGADPNLRDGKGNTPLFLAVNKGLSGMVTILTASRANVNLANAAGETPLIRAVQNRDLATIRALLAAKANPDLTDNLAGKSARDYAAEDTRNPAINRVFADVPKQAKKTGVAGPGL